MMSHLSIASFDWQESWLYIKLTSYLCIIKYSFDSVFVMDSLCKNQLEAVVFIEFSQCYNNLYFLEEEKTIKSIFRHVTWTLKHILGSFVKCHTCLYFFIFLFLIGHSTNALWQRSANYGLQAKFNPLPVFLWPMS